MAPLTFFLELEVFIQAKSPMLVYDAGGDIL